MSRTDSKKPTPTTVATVGLSEPDLTSKGTLSKAEVQERLPEQRHTCESREKKDSELAFGSPEWHAVHGGGRSTPLRDMPEGVLGAAKQVRKFCLECVGGSPTLVRHCAGFSCPLWAWRFGKDPRFVKDGDLLDPEKVRALAFATEAVPC